MKAATDRPSSNHLPAQYPLNERIHILASHINRNLMSILRINNCPRVSAMSVDSLRHMPCLIGIGAVIVAAVQNQGFRFDVLRIMMSCA